MQTCCEEMRELVESLQKSKPEEKRVFWNDETLDELVIENAPNIIFRFCPYCGAAIGEGHAESTNPVIKKLQAVVFNQEIDEATTLTARSAILEEAIAEARKVLKAGAHLVK